MKKFICYLFLFMACGNCYAAETIDCVVESCDGWLVEYENLFNGKGAIYARNLTGEPAFRLKVVVDYYDMFGDPIDRIESKTDGPIYKYFAFETKENRKAYTMKASLFYSKTYDTDSVESSVIGAK